jgi:ABC-type transport system involved in multi-copper enzyme maturation permease subunit
VATIWLQVAIMSACFVVVSLLAGAPLGGGHVAAIGLAAVELAVLVAVATLFSSFTTPMLASLFSAGFYVVGHVTRDLRELGLASGSAAVERTTAWMHRVLPDLESFNLTVQAVHGLPIPGSEIGLALLYGLGYASVLLAVAALIFERRDFR